MNLLSRAKGSIAARAKRSFHKLGLDVGDAKNTLDRVRSSWLERLDIQLTVDGGANLGQYAQKLFDLGYSGRVVSIEPLPDVYPDLHTRTLTNSRWTCLPVALGSEDGEIPFRVAANRVSSSILEVSRLHEDVAPTVRETTSLTVPVRRLDTVWADIEPSWTATFMLKLDLQGYELEALIGAEGVLRRCALIECELSLDSLYSGQPLLEDVIAYISAQGFRPVWLERGLTDHKRRRILQVDALFARRGVSDS